MAGFTIKAEVSGLDELIRQIRAASGELRQDLIDVVGEQATEYNAELRGDGAGSGTTPVDTRALLQSGVFVPQGLGMTWESQVHYAEWVHKSGAPIGQFAVDSGEAFARHFGQDLLDRWEATITEATE